MTNTPEEDALIDSFEEDHPEEHAQEAEDAAATAAATTPATQPDSEPNTTPAASSDPAPAAPAAPPHEEIEEAKGTENAETLPVSPQPTDTLSPLESLPLEVSVEVSRLEMNFKSLSELRPGNLLELVTRPENGVHLVVNGKKLARGELIRVGQLLGVRILEIKK